MSSILIIGNGPSVKNIDFHKIKTHTFGMNNAYKFYKSMNWHPTYWGCFDNFNTSQNKKEHLEFFQEEKPTQCFSLMRESGTCPNTIYVNIRSNVYKFGKSLPFNAWNNVGNTAANCVQIAINKQYENIYLIGIDGGQRKGDINHGWDGYYKKGERVNDPNEQKYHAPVWRSLKEFAKNNNINVYNCNKESLLLNGLFEIRDIDNVYSERI